MNNGYNGDIPPLLREYFDSIADSKPLSRAEENELARRVKEGDLEARDRLIFANLRFVVDVAKRFQRRGLSMPELISAGSAGLITAAERFDEEKGFKFISYAVWWIKQAMLQAIAEEPPVVRLPANKIALLRDVSKIQHREQHKDSDEEMSLEEIAKELAVDSWDVHQALQTNKPPISLDEPAFDEDVGRPGYETRVDNLIDARERADGNFLGETVSESTADMLAVLDERERYVCTLYFGLGGEAPLNLQEIGDVIGVTRERVRQLKERALEKMRTPKSREALRNVEAAIDEQNSGFDL